MCHHSRCQDWNLTDAHVPDICTFLIIVSLTSLWFTFSGVPPSQVSIICTFLVIVTIKHVYDLPFQVKSDWSLCIHYLYITYFCHLVSRRSNLTVHCYYCVMCVQFFNGWDFNKIFLSYLILLTSLWFTFSGMPPQWVPGQEPPPASYAL